MPRAQFIIGLALLIYPAQLGLQAQCCHLCKIKKVDGVASEDSDCLTDGAPKVLMNFKATDGVYITEFDHEKVGSIIMFSTYHRVT